MYTDTCKYKKQRVCSYCVFARKRENRIFPGCVKIAEQVVKCIIEKGRMNMRDDRDSKRRKPQLYRHLRTT